MGAIKLKVDGNNKIDTNQRDVCLFVICRVSPDKCCCKQKRNDERKNENRERVFKKVEREGNSVNT